MGRQGIIAVLAILALVIPSSAFPKADDGTVKEVLLTGEELVENFFAYLRQCSDSNYDREKKDLPPIDFSSEIIKMRAQTVTRLRALMNQISALKKGSEQAHIEIGKKVLANYLSCLKLHEVLISVDRRKGMKIKSLSSPSVGFSEPPSIISAHPSTVYEGRIEELIGASIASKTEESLKIIDSLP